MSYLYEIVEQKLESLRQSVVQAGVVEELGNGLFEKELISGDKKAYAVVLDQKKTSLKACDHLVSATLEKIKYDECEKSDTSSFYAFFDVLRAIPQLKSFADDIESLNVPEDTGCGNITTESQMPWRQDSDKQPSKQEDGSFPLGISTMEDSSSFYRNGTYDPAAGSGTCDPATIGADIDSALGTYLTEDDSLQHVQTTMETASIHEKDSLVVIHNSPPNKVHQNLSPADSCDELLNATPYPLSRQPAGPKLNNDTLTSLMDRLHLKERQNSDLQTRLVTIEDFNKEIQKELYKTNEEIRVLKDRIEELDSEKKQLSEQNKQLIEENKFLIEENKCLTEDKSALEDEKANLESRVEALERTVQELTSFRLECDKKHAEYEKQLQMLMESTDGSGSHVSKVA